MEGQSLLPVLNHPDQTMDAPALSQYARFREKYMGRALRTDRYRFVMWTEVSSGQVVERELYDHRTDPNESRNLAGNADQLRRVRQLEAQLRQAF